MAARAKRLHKQIIDTYHAYGACEHPLVQLAAGTKLEDVRAGLHRALRLCDSLDLGWIVHLNVDETRKLRQDPGQWMVVVRDEFFNAGVNPMSVVGHLQRDLTQGLVPPLGTAERALFRSLTLDWGPPEGAREAMRPIFLPMPGEGAWAAGASWEDVKPHRGTKLTRADWRRLCLLPHEVARYRGASGVWRERRAGKR